MALCLALIAALVSGAVPAVLAQDGSAGDRPGNPRQAELMAAATAAQASARSGPAAIALIEQGQLRLPDGYMFIPAAEASRLMRALGNNPGSNLLGMVIFAKDGLDWFSILTFNNVGYIKDDDARDWNADELMTQLREGTEAGNEQRASRGFPAIEVAGWIEKPVYAAGTHRLVWSALVRDKGAPPEAGASVNYNTYALGRDGYMQLNLVTSRDRIERDKPHAHTLLASLDYLAGKGYEDFNPSTDKVAAYGLAALVAGAAAKKLGFFAAMIAILLKSWKIGAIVIFGLFAAIGKLFSRNKT